MRTTASDQGTKTMVKNMKVWGQKIAATPETARQALIEMGILDKKGKPSKQYYPDCAN
ncbi:MAG: hypothetical protein WCK54_06620 [Desulfuromonadales bacterium]